MRTLVAALAAALVVTAALLALPSGRSANACGIAGPYDFDTYEYPNQGAGYGHLIELAAWGRLPQLNHTIMAGDTIDLRYQGIETGPRGARTALSTAHRIPPVLLKSIVWNESAWANANTSVPWGAVGPALRSFDCGYGLGQITTGMANSTGTASGRQALIATHPAANLMEAIRILADKWNGAPEVRPIAGTGNPAHIEDWYYAVWSYNGFAFTNHPFNPAREALRGSLYHCYSPEAPAALRENWLRGHYTYPELVYGCIEYPPARRNSSTLLWQPVDINTPAYFQSEQTVPVFNAFKPEVYSACASGGFSGGCPGMDYPTTIEEIGYLPHQDPSPDPGSGAGVLGSPSLAVGGPSSAALVLPHTGSATSTTVTVSNSGTSLAAFRVRTSESWLVARHPSDPDTRSLDGGVAVGSDVPVTVGGTVQSGYTNTLIVTVDRARYPGGDRSATLWIEPLYGSGSVFRLDVTVDGINPPGQYKGVIPGTTRE